jgi:hypothetical protein
MADPGCYGPDCFFLGDKWQSMATKGPCTDTAGYISNAEIKTILSDATRVTHASIDSGSHSNILVYDGNQWVGWMSDGLKSQRNTLYRNLNMGGVTDWAADLSDYHDSPPPPSDSWSSLILDLKAGRDPSLGGIKQSGNWSSLTCDDESMDKLDYTPAQRWAMMDGKDAWADVIKVWKAKYLGTTTKFSEAVSMMVGGSPDANCGTFREDNNCQTTIPGGCLKTPAGAEIWNSLVLIHEVRYPHAFSAAANLADEVYRCTPPTTRPSRTLPPSASTLRSRISRTRLPQSLHRRMTNGSISWSSSSALVLVQRPRGSSRDVSAIGLRCVQMFQTAI